MKTTPLEKDILKQLRQKMPELKKELASCELTQKAKRKLTEIESILEQGVDHKFEGLGISAQVSLYPLRVSSLSPFINKALRIFDDLGLETHPGSMSTIITGSNDAVWQALSDAFAVCAIQGELVMTVTVSNACPLLEKSGQTLTKD